MKNRKPQKENSEISALRKQAETSLKDDPLLDFSENSVVERTNELQAMRLELEMQNEELQSSYLKLESEKIKFAGFFDLAPMGYLVLESLTTIGDINKTGLNLLNLNRSQVLKKRLQSFVFKEDLDLFNQFIYQLQKSMIKQSCELRMVTSTKQIIYCSLQGIASKSDEKLRYYLTFTDITESRKAGQQLLETKNRLQMTLSASGAGTWNYDVTQNLFLLDDFCYSLIGLDSVNFNGNYQSFLDLINVNDRNRFEKSLNNTIQYEKELDLEFRMKLPKQAEKHIAIRGQIIKTIDDTRNVAGILMDITEKVNLQKQAEELKSNQQKILLKTTFHAQEKERKAVSEALHDSVCQLLYGIKLNVQALQAQNKGKTPSSFLNINTLIDQSIKETRAISYQLTPSVLTDFGFKAGVDEMATRLSTEKFKINTKIGYGISNLPADFQLFVFRIIQELLNNTIKHSYAHFAFVNVKIDADKVKISVGDDGKGVANDTNLYSSSGSGLRGIKNRVYLLNGIMNVHTAENKGFTTIIIFNINDAIISLRTN